jgi:hypothetical protein
MCHLSPILKCFIFTSVPYVWLLTVFSLPTESLLPQWKWSCANTYLPLRGPPDTVAGLAVSRRSIAEMLQKGKYNRQFRDTKGLLSPKCYSF